MTEPNTSAAQLAHLLDEAERRAATEASGAAAPSGAAEGALWRRLDPVEPVPSPRLRARFDQLLEEHRQTRPGWWRRADRWLEAIWPSRPSVQLATVAAALLLGVGLSRLGDRATPSPVAAGAAGAALESELLALLDRPATAERLQAVSLSRSALRGSEPAAGHDRIVSGLLHALASDPSENVRLAAVEALEQVADQRLVQRGLAVALANQRSPLLQVTVAELLTTSGARESAAALQGLLEQPTLDPAVRVRAYELLEALTPDTM